MNRLIDLIDRWSRPRILVAGDFMVDELLYGNAERLSPDAPVPILAIERTERRPGGAANVCLDLAALRCEIRCVGVTGDDEPGRRLREDLSAAGCGTDGLVTTPDRPTTVKRSYIGLAQHRHAQKMFRADFEVRTPLPSDVADAIVDAAKSMLAQVDALVIEDYDKGVLTGGTCRRLIEAAREAGKPVLVDPAAIEDYERYRGATALTPNRTEASLATGLALDGDAEILSAARSLREGLDLEAVVMTLDKAGAMLLTDDGPVVVPTEARTVYDVTGAGDMVVAALAAGHASGADWVTAVELANVAAGLEVEKFGVVPIPLDDILLYLYRREHRSLGKVRTPEQLAPELEAHRRDGRKIAFTNGCFDIVHAGHIEVLRGARAEADLLVLAVNSDVSIRSLKGPTRPIVPEKQRLEVLAELECVDYVVLFGDGTGGDADTPRPLLELLRPDVLVKGGTYSHDEVVGWEIVESYGGRVATVQPVEGLSTTYIVEKIRSQP